MNQNDGQLLGAPPLKGAGRQTVDTRSTFGSPWNLCGKTVLFLNCWWRGLQWNEFCSRASSWLMEKERMDEGWIVGAGHLQDHTVSQLLESAKRTFPVIVKFYSFSVYGQTSSDYLVERSKEHKRSHAWFTFCCESNESRSTNKDIININELFPFSSRFKGCILIWSLIFEFEHFFMSTDNFLTSSSLSSTKWLC